MTFRGSAPPPRHRASRPPQSSKGKGSAGITSCAARIVTTAPIGSTTPESTPPAKALPLLSPSARRGIEMMAPSGKFWMAMPRDRGPALAAVICALPAKAGIHHTDCHALRDIVQGHRQYHHRSAAQSAFGPSASSLPTCGWGYQMIQCKQNSTPNQNPANAGEKAKPPQPLRLFDGRDQQTPDRCRHHHTGGKARKRALHQITQCALHENTRCAQRCTQKGNQNPQKFLSMKSPPFMVYTQKQRYFYTPCSVMLLTSCAHL